MKRKILRVIIINTIFVMNLSISIHPVISNSLKSDSQIIYDGFDSWNLAIHSNYLYSASDSGIDVFSIESNGSLIHDQLIEKTHYGMVFYVDDRGVLYVPNPSDHAVDLYYRPSEGAPLELVSQLNFTTFVVIEDFFVKHNLLYIACATSGFMVCNVSDIFSPYPISIIELGECVSDVYVDENKAYVAGYYYPTDYYGFAIVDVSNSSNPVVDLFENNATLYYRIYQTYVYEGFNFCFSTYSILKFRKNDLSFEFEEIGTITKPFVDYIVLDDVLYICGRDDVFLFSLDNLSNPTFIDKLDAIFCWSIEAWGDRIYLSRGLQGLLNIPNYPIVTETPGTTTSLASLHEYLHAIILCSLSVTVFIVRYKKRKF